MMKSLIVVLILMTLCADVYIYRMLICRRFGRSAVRVGYMVFALLTYGAAFSAFYIRSLTNIQTPAATTASMWLIWIFILIALPKMLYALGFALDSLISRRRATTFRWFFGVIAILSTVVMVCGATVGRTRLRTEQVEICSPRIPAAFDGYRVVQISDIHVGTMCRPEKRIAALAEAIEALDPDIVVHTGDLVNINGNELTPAVVEALSRITAPDGVWSIWGNHDLGFYIKDTLASPLLENHAALSAKVAKAGWRTLSDESVRLYRENPSGVRDSIILSGVDYPTERLNGYNNTLGGTDLDKAFAGIDPEHYSIVLAHTPELWREIMAKGFGDLTLSGHVHALQTKLHLPGKELSPAAWIYAEWSGKYESGDENNNNVLYVNDGIGCVGYPMRIGARPEITVFTFRQCE